MARAREPGRSGGGRRGRDKSQVRGRLGDGSCKVKQVPAEPGMAARALKVSARTWGGVSRAAELPGAQ